MLFALLSLPLLAKAQINHSPVITSTPNTNLVAGGSYSYTIKASDQDNDSLFFSLSSSPATMKIDQNGLVTWQETKAGLYNVAIEVSDQKGGYTSQTFQINVMPAALKSIAISPNDRPTVMVDGKTIQFQAQGYDVYNNEISDITFQWTADEKIGTVDQTGLFQATHGGIGTVTATKDDIKATVGVVVKNAVATVANANTANTNTATEKPEETTKTTTKPSQASTNTNTQQTISSQTTEENKEVNQESTETCHNWRTWIIIMLLIIYGLMLAVYYFFIKRYRIQRVRGWWIIPLFLTIIGEVIYFKYFCQGTYIWWPWILLAIGVVLTAYYWWLSRKKVDYLQSELPF